MEYPFGHHHNHHHRRDEDDEEARGYPRPPFSDPSTYPPPPHQPTNGGPHSYPPPECYPPPPPSYGGNYPPPPEVPAVYHSSHHSRFESDDYPPPPPQPTYAHQEEEERHHFRPHIPSFIQDHFPSHNQNTEHVIEGGPESDLGDLANKPTYRIYCKASDDRYAVAIRDGKTILTHTDPSDPTQHWIKDERYSIRVKDQDGYPSFALVNRATMQAMKHSVRGHPVQLVHYKPGDFDGSILWTESKDLGHGYRIIRNVNNIRLVLDAFNGDKDHGGVHDGTVVALYESWKGDNTNQQWKIVPY